MTTEKRATGVRKSDCGFRGSERVPTLHRDGTVTIYNPTSAMWVRTITPTEASLRELSNLEQTRVMRHLNLFLKENGK